MTETPPPEKPVESVQPDELEQVEQPAQPGSTPEATAAQSRAARSQARSSGRAGRDLVSAIGVGLLLAAIVVASLVIYRAAFVVLVAAAVMVAMWEVARAVERVNASPPMFPAMAGGLAMLALAWFRGIDGLSIGLLFTVLAIIIWRLADSSSGSLIDASVGIFISAYVPFLAGFAALLVVPDNGARRVVTFIAAVVCSDTGGYAAGALLGKHRMAPRISPKKSWEGFGGSIAASAILGLVLFSTWLHGQWWQGLIFGVAIAITSVLGDLAESMIKRDLGIKDMGNLLPGHGGMMDRLDSLLPAAAVAWMLMTAFIPAH